MSGPKKCPNCGAEIDPDIAEEFVCSECGAEFMEQELEEGEPDNADEDDI